MENWGRILFAEDVSCCSIPVFHRVGPSVAYDTSSHRMSTVVSATLVTMALWDDLWAERGLRDLDVAQGDRSFIRWRVGLHNERVGARHLTRMAGAALSIVTPDPRRVRPNAAFDPIT